MFYRMIERKRDQWFASGDCTVRTLVDYIVKAGQMRDAQVDAIKTYLFLKVACDCKPLNELFTNGIFNTLDIAELSLPDSVKDYLRNNPAAAALYEYASQTNDSGEQVSKKLQQQIAHDPTGIDYRKFFIDTFYGVSYTDYLFSLPMGAGKTFLMAAFIYLDLYFAANEPMNPAFAHNFIIFAPSGLKSSVVPSLRTIQKFDPAWVLPEPAASEIKRMISFEVLDQNKTAKKSNKTKNPNVQKIANHQPLNELFGLVAVTNAEKVILDRVAEKDGQILLDAWSDEAEKQANELRFLIGKLPALAIFIDEVHHAVSNADKEQERKLRAVVNRWSENGAINMVAGFSGTPYLDKAEKIEVIPGLSVATAEISNIVYFYPLIDGVGNFLKRPVIKIAEQASSARIIEDGVRTFLDTYKDTVYADGTTAKLGIYCGTISKLEELVYPLVLRVAKEYGLSEGSILRFYRESNSKDPNAKKYKAPADNQMEFDILDKAISKTRIILLVQIGKEGWDCRSLTGIILSQEGDCPKNMVLQTSCRCLRQVVKGSPETALIYLNDTNAAKLNEQLQQQHHISLKEFANGGPGKTELNRYSRMEHLKLPKIDFYQLAIRYTEENIEELAPEKNIPAAADNAKSISSIIRTTDLSMEDRKIEVDDTERGTEYAGFDAWLYGIVKGSFGTLSMEELKPYRELLRAVFETITYEKDGNRAYSSRYDRASVEANIRKAFARKRSYWTDEEVIPADASLLRIENLTSPVYTEKPEDYYPAQELVEKIIQADQGKIKMPEKVKETIRLLEDLGNTAMADDLKKQYAPPEFKDRSFHYLPYHTDSGFEQTFLREALAFPQLEELGLEVYYNGDRAMTEFKIKCYKQNGGKWQYIGMYTPDFLILQRRDGEIYKVIIVETKGEIYANDPTFKDKRRFMETEFLRQNNRAFGYARIEYLYLEDTMPDNERVSLTSKVITTFMGGIEF